MIIFVVELKNKIIKKKYTVHCYLLKVPIQIFTKPDLGQRWLGVGGMNRDSETCVIIRFNVTRGPEGEKKDNGTEKE